MRSILFSLLLVAGIAGCTQDAATRIPPHNPDPVHYIALWKTDRGDYYEQAGGVGQKGHWVLCPHGTIFYVGDPPYNP